MESGWGCEIVRTLKKVRRGGLESSTASALEDILASLVRAAAKLEPDPNGTASSADSVKKELKDAGVINVCQTHKMKELAAVMSSSSSSKPAASK